jgi:hypothetical protein
VSVEACHSLAGPAAWLSGPTGHNTTLSLCTWGVGGVGRTASLCALLHVVACQSAIMAWLLVAVCQHVAHHSMHCHCCAVTNVTQCDAAESHILRSGYPLQVWCERASVCARPCASELCASVAANTQRCKLHTVPVHSAEQLLPRRSTWLWARTRPWSCTTQRWRSSAGSLSCMTARGQACWPSPTWTGCSLPRLRLCTRWAATACPCCAHKAETHALCAALRSTAWLAQPLQCKGCRHVGTATLCFEPLEACAAVLVVATVAYQWTTAPHRGLSSHA